MTLELLIHAIVRQTTLLIAQLATSGGARAPLAQVADQVFLDLVHELERQGVSRKVSADMFGLGLRTYQRKIQRLRESTTDQGHSLWVAVFDYVQSRGPVPRADVLGRFADDEEVQVRGVLHDLCENRLLISSGSGSSQVYRAASEEEIGALRQARTSEGLEELLWALVYREGPLGLAGLALRTQIEEPELERLLQRLVDAGRIDQVEEGGARVYRASSLFVPLGSSVGWEAAVFDHFKALVNTIACRLRTDRSSPSLADRVGGSTYTLDVWPGHPLESEVFDSLKTMRSRLSELRERVDGFNAGGEIPDDHTRVVLYLGQCPIPQGGGESEDAA